MIGIIQRVLLDLLHETGGNELVERTLVAAGLEPGHRFRMDRNYSDTEFQTLVGAAMETTGLDRATVMDLYARHFLVFARQLFPKFFEMSPDSRSLLLRQPAIHASLAAGLSERRDPAAVRDKFAIDENADGSLTVHYRSPNRLCDLYRRLAERLGEAYGETIRVETLRCGQSDAYCRLRLRWPQHAPEPAAEPACGRCAQGQP